VTGPSGAGKGTLIERVLPRFPELALAVSATTRARRRGEHNGAHYYFLTREEFDRRIEANEFLEWVDYVGNRYGTLLSEVERLRAAGKAPLLELETEGALRVKRRVDGAVTIFVTAPVEELERRLRDRATESTGEIGERIALARQQLEEADSFDYVVENDDLERAADELTQRVRGLLAPAGTMSRP
jgi:guanylate kinase